MKTTGNLGLKKPEGTDIVDINDLNGNMDILDTAVKAVQDHAADTVKHITTAERTAWNAKASTTVATTAAAGLMAAADKVLSTNLASLPTTTGTATAYLVAISAGSTLVAGLRFSFKAHVASGTNPTINPNALGAKAVKNPDGTAASFALNGVYTVVYDGTAFQLQGKGGGIDLNGTNAVPAQVLVGKTFLSSNSAGIQTGTMQNYDGMSQAGVLANPGVGAAYATIPSAGFYGTTSEIGLYDADFVSQNIKSGVNIFGVHGTFSGGSMTSESVRNVSAYNFSYNETNVYFTLSAGTTKNWTGKVVAITISGITTEGNSTQNGIQCTDMPDSWFYGSASAFGNVVSGGDSYDISTNGGTVRLRINDVSVNPSTIDISCQYTYSGDGSISIVGYPSFNVEIGGLA